MGSDVSHVARGKERYHQTTIIMIAVILGASRLEGCEDGDNGGQGDRRTAELADGGGGTAAVGVETSISSTYGDGGALGGGGGRRGGSRGGAEIRRNRQPDNHPMMSI